MSIVVNWAKRAWNWFMKNGGTQQEATRQEAIVIQYGLTNVPYAASAEITAPGHAGGTNPNEPWHITTVYFDGRGTRIPGQRGGAWHVYP